METMDKLEKKSEDLEDKLIDCLWSGQGDIYSTS